MIPRRTRALLWLATSVAAALMAFGWIRLSSPPDPRERLRTLRDELTVLRASADSCRDAVAVEERALRIQEAGGWPAASETLQAHWRACRAVAETHNTIADSARALARELGLWVDSLAEETPKP